MLNYLRRILKLICLIIVYRQQIIYYVLICFPCLRTFNVLHIYVFFNQMTY